MTNTLSEHALEEGNKTALLAEARRRSLHGGIGGKVVHRMKMPNPGTNWIFMHLRMTQAASKSFFARWGDQQLYSGVVAVWAFLVQEMQYLQKTQR